MNWATYLCDERGRVVVTNEPIVDDGSTWFTDGYGDYVRHFLAAMAAVPEWAPPGENHLLSSTSVIRAIDYGADAIRYTPFDATSREVLRLSRPPLQVCVGGKRLGSTPNGSDGFQLRRLDSGDYSLTVQHSRAGEVVIDFTSTNPDGDGCAVASGAPPGCSCDSAAPGGAAGLLPALAALARALRKRRAPGASSTARPDASLDHLEHT